VTKSVTGEVTLSVSVLGVSDMLQRLVQYFTPEECNVYSTDASRPGQALQRSAMSEIII